MFFHLACKFFNDISLTLAWPCLPVGRGLLATVAIANHPART